MIRPECQGIDEAVAGFLTSFSKPSTLLVAVSGGGDSVGLLLALDDALKSGRFPGFSLVASTVDHALRANSDEEARWVAALCSRLSILHETRRWEGPKPATGIQAAAREARYRLLVDAARSHGADAILTAHNLEDQSETIAMRKARRETGAGLAGIAPATLVSRSVWVLRPLLAVPRVEIRTFLRMAGQDWIEDPSNASRRFERVRVRQDRAQADCDGSLGGDLEEQQAAAEARSLDARKGAAFLASDVRVFDASLAWLSVTGIDAALKDEAALRAVLMLVAVLGGRTHLLDQDASVRVRAFLETATLSRLTAGRVVFDRRREGLFLYREQRGVHPVIIPPAGVGIWDGRWRVENLGASAITVDGGSLGETDHLPDSEEVPPGVARRVRLGRPRVMVGATKVDEPLISVEPVLAPFDSFLTVFDLPLANAIARLFGRAPYLTPPSCEVRR